MGEAETRRGGRPNADGLGASQTAVAIEQATNRSRLMKGECLDARQLKKAGRTFGRCQVGGQESWRNVSERRFFSGISATLSETSSFVSSSPRACPLGEVFFRRCAAPEKGRRWGLVEASAAPCCSFVQTQRRRKGREGTGRNVGDDERMKKAGVRLAATRRRTRKRRARDGKEEKKAKERLEGRRVVTGGGL